MTITLDNCTACGVGRSEQEFARNRNKCKPCINQYYREYNKRNREIRAAQFKVYREKNLNAIKAKQAIYNKNTRDKKSAYNKEYRRRTLVARRAYATNYEKNRKAADVNYKLARLLRDRVRKALKHNLKSGSAVQSLGCSIDEFRSYLEAKFQSGMGWENHGLHGWHLDHIRPLSSFNLTDRAQFMQACHYSNLQPLWAKDNFRKGDSL